MEFFAKQPVNIVLDGNDLLM